MARFEIAQIAWDFFSRVMPTACERVSLDIVNELGHYVRPPIPKKGEPHYRLLVHPHDPAQGQSSEPS